MTDEKMVMMLRRDGYHSAADRLEALLAENDHLREVTKMMPRPEFRKEDSDGA